MILKQKRIIGIVGGVGPMAGVSLHKAIINYTKTDGADQSHLEVHHLSRNVSDRTEYLLGKTSINPCQGAMNTTRALWLGANSVGKKLVIGVPCITFHSPKIWVPFINNIINLYGTDVEIINMLHESIKDIQKDYPHVKRIGILCTTGTRNTNLYRNLLVSNNYDPIYVSDDIQEKVHRLIYHPVWGIKSVSSPVSSKAKYILEEAVDALIKKDVDLILLGCTELPLAFDGVRMYKDTKIPLFDPIHSLAKSLIKKCVI